MSIDVATHLASETPRCRKTHSGPRDFSCIGTLVTSTDPDQGSEAAIRIDHRFFFVPMEVVDHFVCRHSRRTRLVCDITAAPISMMSSISSTECRTAKRTSFSIA